VYSTRFQPVWWLFAAIFYPDCCKIPGSFAVCCGACWYLIGRTFAADSAIFSAPDSSPIAVTCLLIGRRIEVRLRPIQGLYSHALADRFLVIPRPFCRPFAGHSGTVLLPVCG
jgi:hypothetical protein